MLAAIALQSFELIVGKLADIVEKPAHQRALAIIDAAAGHEAQRRPVARTAWDERICAVSAASRCNPSVQKYPSRFFFSIAPLASRSIARPFRSDRREA